MAVLPTQPRRGVTPGGMPDTGMQGQGRGAPTGLPKPMNPTTGMPGMGNVDKNVPDPEDLVELFTAYTTGQLSREHLINQLDIFSEGQGGILGLLESMEKEAAGGSEMEQPAAPQSAQAIPTMPGQVGPPSGAGLENAGSIPPLEKPLDKRHQRISMLLQNYGLPAHDADQMSTVLNPNEEGVPYAWEQEQINLTFGDDPRTATGMGTGNVTKQGAFDAARASISPNIKSLSDDQIWDVINTPAPNAPMTSADINVDHTPRSQVSRDQGGTMSTWEAPEEDDYEEQVSTSNVNVQPNIVWDPIRDQYIDTNKMSLLPPPAPAAPQETGQLVWDNDSGQMVDSGTWMPPKAGPGLNTAQLAQAQNPGGGAYGDMSQQATQNFYNQGGGAVGDMAAAADTVRATPAINGGAYGDMGTAATNRAIEQGGGAYGDMATAADTVTQRNFPGAFGDAAWTAQNTPPAVPPAGPTISAEEYAKFKESGPVGANPLGGLEQIGADLFGKLFQKMGWENPGLLETKEAKDVENYLKDQLGFTSTGVSVSPRKDIQDEDAAMQSLYRSQGYLGSGSGDIHINIGDSPEAQADGLLEPQEIFAPTDKSIPGTPGYEGTDVTHTEEGVQVGKTEPFETGFKTVEDFDFPELRGFLNSLSESARSDLAGQGLAGSIVTALTDITNARVAGQVSLANNNTQAAVEFLDRAALNLRTEAQQNIEKGVAIGQIENTATLAREAEEYKQVMQRYMATGKIPQLDPDTGDFKRNDDDTINFDETLERELSYDELQQDRTIRMSELFGKLINFTRTGEIKKIEGMEPLADMQTLEAQQFGLSKILKQSELAGVMMGEDGKPLMVTKKNPKTGQDEQVPLDTFEARRYAWEYDIAQERIRLEDEQQTIDVNMSELEAATVQYGQQLTSHIEAGRLAEAVTARKEKTIAENKKREMEKNQLKVSTLLSLADPSTMLFAKRYKILDDIGAAIGVDFSGEVAIPEPPPMVQPGTYPTLRMLQEATPAERQIMMAETAAWGGAAADNASAMAAQQRIAQWTPGAKPLRRGVIQGSAR